MKVYTYMTDDSCPNCGSNIRNALLDHVYSEGRRDFKTKCPNCSTMLEISVEAVPSFLITKAVAEHNLRPTSETLPDLRALDTTR